MALSINELYRFYFDHQTQGSVQFFPLNNKLTWEYENDKNNVFFRKKLETALKIDGDHFKMLHKLERSKYKCDKVPVRIELLVGESYIPFFNGYFALIDADEWNVDFCFVKIKPRIEDEYSCLLSSWNYERDFIGASDAPLAITVKTFQGQFEEKICKGRLKKDNPNELKVPVTSCLENPLTWTFQKYSDIYIQPATGFTFGNCHFVREYTTTLPTGEGWVKISENKWVRPISVVGAEYSEPFNNGRKLSEVIEFLLKDCELQIKSIFFGINTSEPILNNNAYKAAKQHYQKLVIFQKSDVRRNNEKDSDGNPIPIQQATKAIIKLKDLLEWLKNMFNVYFIVDNGFLILEHLTYFTQNQQNMINLTTEDFDINLSGKYKYSYLNQDIPLAEKWTWMESSTDPIDFDGKAIEYNVECSYENENSNTKEYGVSKVTTNVLYIVKEKQEISNDGFVIVSTDDYNNIQIAKGELTGQNLVNGSMSFANLQYNCHRDGRPQKTGKMNDKDEIFFNIKKQREQKDIYLRLTEEDIINFNPLHRVKTQLGWGEIIKATIEAPLHSLKVQLKHAG